MTGEALVGFAIGFTFGVIFGVAASVLFAWRVAAALVRFGRRLREARERRRSAW